MREMLQLVSAEPGVCLKNGIHQHLVFGGQGKGIRFYVSCNDGTPAPVRAGNFIHNGTVLPRPNLLLGSVDVSHFLSVESGQS